jgi:hypothetical protein
MSEICILYLLLLGVVAVSQHEDVPLRSTDAE